jgi:hypothetical protein
VKYKSLNSYPVFRTWFAIKLGYNSINQISLFLNLPKSNISESIKTLEYFEVISYVRGKRGKLGKFDILKNSYSSCPCCGVDLK